MQVSSQIERNIYCQTGKLIIKGNHMFWIYIYDVEIDLILKI